MAAKGILVFADLSLIIVFTLSVVVANGTLEIRNTQLGSYTLVPTNITCENYNYERMTCTWSLGIQYGNYSYADINFNYQNNSEEVVQMYFTRYRTNDSSEIHCNGNNGFVQWHVCQNPKPTSCSWKYPYDSALEWFSVMVAVINRNLDTYTVAYSHRINVYDTVKPAPVKDIKAMPSSEGRQCLSLSWTPPDISMDFICSVSSSSECTGSKTQTILTRSHTRMNDIQICDLHPYSNISFSVKCRMMIKNAEKGYWSDSVAVSKRVDHDVPNVAPNTTDGLYEVSSVENGFISIQLYFTPLNTCELNDDPIYVVYSVEALDKSVIVPHPNFSVNINLPENREVNISLEAKNSAGPSNETKVVTIFPEISAPKAAKLNIKHIPKDSGCTEEATITQTEDSTLFTYLYNTVVWCPVELTICKEPLKWVVIYTNETVLLAHDCTLPYRYGLITHGYKRKERRVTSTSIHWLDHYTTVPRNDGFESETGYVFKFVLPSIAAAVVFIACIFIIINRRKWKLRSTNVVRPTCMENSSSCSPSVSTNNETDTLLKHKDESNSSIIAAWAECIDKKNGVSDANLSHVKILPTNNDLQQISRTFGRRSNTLRDVCENICGFITEKRGNITAVWPAYAPSNGEIGFVIEESSTESNIQVNDFKIYTVNPDNTLEKESLEVMLREQEILASCDKYDVDKFKQLKESISNNARSLMNKHKSIIALCPGVVKSVGYKKSGQSNKKSDQHKLIETLCISVRVKKKVRDVLPLDENQIPAEICGFPTDVLQGSFSPFGNGPNDYHKELKIGCGIHAGVTDYKGDILGGTLGGFVQHGTHGLCCITCAHLILSPAELQTAKKNGYFEYAYTTGKRVFQPSCEHSTEFGRLVAAAFKEGSHTSPGVEAALIKVLCRHPKSGSFPEANEGIVYKLNCFLRGMHKCR